MNLTAYILRLLQDFEIMGKAGKIVRLVRVMRIMRIFKLVRHFAGLQSLIYTLNQVRRPRQRFSIYIFLFQGAVLGNLYLLELKFHVNHIGYPVSDILDAPLALLLP